MADAAHGTAAVRTQQAQAQAQAQAGVGAFGGEFQQGVVLVQWDLRIRAFEDFLVQPDFGKVGPEDRAVPLQQCFGVNRVFKAGHLR
ncbi:hypothetical protein D3C80_1381630 [compost metagenome]